MGLRVVIFEKHLFDIYSLFNANGNALLVFLIEKFDINTSTISVTVSHKVYTPGIIGWGETRPIASYDSSVKNFGLSFNKKGDILLVSSNKSRRYLPDTGFSESATFRSGSSRYVPKLAIDPTGQHAVLLWNEKENISYTFWKSAVGWSDLKSLLANVYQLGDLDVDSSGNAVMLWNSEFSSIDIYASIYSEP